jgi:NADH-quinone oxidoreductase subunit G
VSATIREGKVKRILSRNHPEIDRGWLCDKGRFTYPHLRAPDRVTSPLRRGPKGLVEIGWDEALDAAEELLREAGDAVVTALSGTETTEIAYALGRLLRGGVRAHSAVLPEATSSALDAFRLPLSAIGDAELVVVVGDDAVVERAPIVDLWIKEARRRGAEIVVCSPAGDVSTEPGGAAALCQELAAPRNTLGKKLRASERAVLVWSGPGGGGGARLAELAHALGFAGKPGCGAFHVPATANARGVAAAWAASADADETNPEPIKLLVVSGDEAAADPNVRALAEKSEHVLVLTMFHELAGGWADLVLPSTAALERDGTTMNLEGRVQRLRRAVLPPCPDELAWIAKLAGRFDVELAPQAAQVFEELAGHLFRDLSLEDLGLHAPLPARHEYEAPPSATTPGSALPTFADEHYVGALRLHRFRALFSGPAVERVPQLDFQRPSPEVELAAADAERRGIASGDAVLVRSNGTSVELRARVNRKLVEGVARIAEEHAADLHAAVEVIKT